MKSIFPRPILSVVLLIVWLLLNNTVTIGHVVLGSILAIIIPIMTARFWPETVCLSKPFVLLKFVLIVLWDILVANIVVAKLILGNKQNLAPKFLHIPLEITDPLAISILANTISLTPGTVSCDLIKDKTVLLVHGLHEENPRETIDSIKNRYEYPLKEVFESC